LRAGILIIMTWSRYAKLGPEVVDTAAHRALALEGAVQGHVLLKNEGGRLPLQAAKIRKLALIGPHANGSVIFLGGPNYHGDNTLIEQNTPLLRAGAKLPSAAVTYAEGCTVKCPSRDGFGAAVAAAAAADTVVLFLGLDDTIENEGHDRVSLELPGKQAALATAVAEAATSSVVVVLVNVRAAPACFGCVLAGCARSSHTSRHASAERVSHMRDGARWCVMDDIMPASRGGRSPSASSRTTRKWVPSWRPSCPARPARRQPSSCCWARPRSPACCP
jgi:hypothetical protein